MSYVTMKFMKKIDPMPRDMCNVVWEIYEDIKKYYLDEKGNITDNPTLVEDFTARIGMDLYNDEIEMLEDGEYNIRLNEYEDARETNHELKDEFVTIKVVNGKFAEDTKQKISDLIYNTCYDGIWLIGIRRDQNLLGKNLIAEMEN